MKELKKTPKPQPQLGSHEIISVYNCGSDAGFSFSNQWEKREKRYEKEYRALLRANGFNILGDYDEWFEAYCIMNEGEMDREAAYNKAKLNKTLLQCRESLKDAKAVTITAAEGLEIVIGDAGREWLLDKINNYFESKECIIPYWSMYRRADYDNEEEGKSRLIKEQELFNELAKEQEDFIQEYEQMRGDRRGLFAKHLGSYVIYFMERIPAWAASLNDSEKYRFIGEMIEKAGILERYKGDWVKNKWARLDKQQRANQIKQWAAAASKVV